MSFFIYCSSTSRSCFDCGFVCDFFIDSFGFLLIGLGVETFSGTVGGCSFTALACFSMYLRLALISGSILGVGAAFWLKVRKLFGLKEIKLRVLGVNALNIWLFGMNLGRRLIIFLGGCTVLLI